jgi:hypothetical protein
MLVHLNDNGATIDNSSHRSMSLLLAVDGGTDEARERTDVRTAFHRISMQDFVVGSTTGEWT